MLIVLRIVLQFVICFTAKGFGDDTGACTTAILSVIFEGSMLCVIMGLCICIDS